MISYRNRRLYTLLSILIITPIGFYSKFYNSPAKEWVNDSLGGVFYEIFWCLVIYLFIPKSKPFVIALFVFAATCTVEFLQLWHPPFLELLRRYFIGQTILGSSFIWTDFPYYVLGSLIGWAWLILLKKYSLRNI